MKRLDLNLQFMSPAHWVSIVNVFLSVPPGPLTFYDVDKRDILLRYLVTRVKSTEQDPDARWIATSNDYLDRIKVVFRRLYNVKMVDSINGVCNDSSSRSLAVMLPISEWLSPDFLQIQHKKIKRASPYCANEIWELEELQYIIKYECLSRILLSTGSIVSDTNAKCDSWFLW